MSKIFRQKSSVSCFYCQATINPLPRNPHSFRCPQCDCWNRYDANWDIISDEPAMYDEKLNSRSFAKRDRLPTMYGSGLFCHTCRMNQTLLANLLSSYLPPPEDPEYEQRAQTLPEYRRSIEARYPPVCANCAPTIEEEIQRRDHMARTSALNGFLRASKPVKRKVERTQRDKDRLAREIAMWKVRGALWAGCLLFALVGHAAIACAKFPRRIPHSLKLALPVIALISLIWTAWDPTYASLKRAQFQGRMVHQRGKKKYNILQSLAWLTRLITSFTLGVSSFGEPWDKLQLWNDIESRRTRMFSSACLLVEVLVLLSSCAVLRLERPPPVRLATDSSAERSRVTSPISPPSTRSSTPVVDSDLLAPLTLSSKPILAPPANISLSKPVFGKPSLVTSLTQPHEADLSNAMDIEDDDESPTGPRDPDAMDWSPIRPLPSRDRPHALNGRSHFGQDEDGDLLRPQRFFAPEEPTGLESLFANTIHLADDEQENAKRQTARAKGRHQHQHRFLRYIPRWPWVVALSVIPLLGVAYKLWADRRESAQTIS